MRRCIWLSLCLIGSACLAGVRSTPACPPARVAASPELARASHADSTLGHSAALVVLALDACSGRPVHGAAARLRGAVEFALQVETDSAGGALLIAPAGSYAVDVRVLGYDRESSSVELRAGFRDTVLLGMWRPGTATQSAPVAATSPTADNARTAPGTSSAIAPRGFPRSIRQSSS